MGGGVEGIIEDRFKLVFEILKSFKSNKLGQSCTKLMINSAAA